MDAYQASVASLLNHMKHCQTDSEGNVAHHNPQDALPSSDATSPKKAKLSPKKLPNGVISSPYHHGCSSSSLSLPQSFIDGAVRIAVSTLEAKNSEESFVANAGLDARAILELLLKTGKVSARLHFEGNDSIQESVGKHKLITALQSVALSDKEGQRVFTPVDMIVVMLTKCSDLSERQLVAMLNYMMRESIPDDIASMFNTLTRN